MKDTLSGVLQKESYKYIRRAATSALESEEVSFTTKPHFDPVTGEILGSLAPNQSGTATVQLGVTIILTADPEVTQVFNRTIYIVKQN